MMSDSVDTAGGDNDTVLKRQFDEFVHIVSHDFAAPLRHTKSFTELLVESLSGKLDSEQQELADIIVQSTAKMQQMMAALLDYSRINSAAEPMSEFAVADLMADVLAEFKSNNPGCSVVVVDHSDGNGSLVQSDRRQIRTVFNQLLSNAVKFSSPDRPLELQIMLQQYPAYSRVKIEDNGIGIAEKFHHKIFSIFYQLDPENTAGVGAGLAMCKHIMQRHNGSIKTSENVTGSVFVVDIPINGIPEVMHDAEV